MIPPELSTKIDTIVEEIYSIAEQNQTLDLTIATDVVILDRNLERIDELELELMRIRELSKGPKLRLVR